MSKFSRQEVEAAYRHFIEAGDSGEWSAWADLHSEDCIWIEHHLGTFHGREAIREMILGTMKRFPMRSFPVEWVLIEDERVAYYPWQVLPDPSGGDRVFRFGCVTILEYAGDGLFSLQEDLYNPNEAAKVIQDWLAAGGQIIS